MGKGKKIITFASDFGYKNAWEAQCKAIILKITPSATIIDVINLVHHLNNALNLLNLFI